MTESICKHVDLSSISVAMLYGVLPDDQENDVPREQRLKNIYAYLEEELEALLPDKAINRKLQDVFSDCLAKINPIYFELGMQAGARLSQELFSAA